MQVWEGGEKTAMALKKMDTNEELELSAGARAIRI